MHLASALDELETDGFVVLKELLGPTEREAIQRALAPLEAGHPLGRNGFEGEVTTRLYALARKGPAFTGLAEHPTIMELLDAALLPNFLLSNLQSIRLHPGETEQPPHTDDGFYLVPRPRGRLGLSTIWAIEAFTADNGATRVFPGSHRWAHEHPDDMGIASVPVEMPAGSVVVFDAALWHYGGANRSSGTRLALTAQYCQPWLRPQESQLLIVPPEEARPMSARMRSMLGYSIHPPFIGQVDGKHPLRLVDPSYRSDHKSQAARLADEVLRRPPS